MKAWEVDNYNITITEVNAESEKGNFVYVNMKLRKKNGKRYSIFLDKLEAINHYNSLLDEKIEKLQERKILVVGVLG